ncbi:MAG: hypothetical protein WB615_11065 [Candidatus Tumulicola sp.]
MLPSSGRDGGSPTAGLTVHAGALYGTTEMGGAKYKGVLYEITP